MNSIQPIHVVDCHSPRRQSVTRVLFDMGLHAEPYENLDELLAHAPSAGMVFIEASENRLSRALDQIDRGDLQLPVIGYSESPTPISIVRAVHFGASGYLAWPFDMTDVWEVLAMVGRMRHVESIGIASKRDLRPVALSGGRTLLMKLTNRERQVLDQIMDGQSSREIGDNLSISHRTVEIHRQNLMRKLQARRVGDAVRIAIEAKQEDASLGRAALLRDFGRVSITPKRNAA